jgi:hypothetical protein
MILQLSFLGIDIFVTIHKILYHKKNPQLVRIFKALDQRRPGGTGVAVEGALALFVAVTQPRVVHACAPRGGIHGLHPNPPRSSERGV